MRRPAVCRVIALVFALQFPAVVAAAQTRPEVIRGRVTTDSGRVIPGADVIVTMAPNRETFRASSDTGGRYEIHIAAGTGDYLVYVGITGRKAFRKRVMRVASETTFVVDARLALDVTLLAGVRTTAQRTRPPRGDETPSTIGGLTSQVATVTGALSPDQMGDLNAMAATVPGVATTPDGGVSVFGVDPSQNRTTVNGMAFDAGSLPRELSSTTHVSSSVYDPTIGGFGGAQINADIRAGQTLTLGSGHLTVDAPQLQAADATARELGQRYSNVTLGYGRGGELQQDTWIYSAAIQGSRRMSPAPSILRADAAALARLGVAQDSADRFLELVSGMGVPISAQGIGSDIASTSIGGGFRIDRAQASSYGVGIDTKTRVSISGIGSYRRTNPTAASTLALPARDGHSAGGNAFVQATLSQYFGADAAVLSETKTAVSFNDQHSDPYLALPGGSVRVTSALSDGTSSVSGLQFGGGALSSDNRTWRWEASNELSLSPTQALAHRFKLFSQVQVDGYDQSSQGNGLGTFTYNSLADLADNSAASYSRTLYSPERTGGEASGAFAIADYWTKSPDLQFVFGPRLEWNVFTDAPRENAEVARLFGARTDVSPSGVSVSPRLGFNWFYRGARASSRGGGSSNLGSIFTPTKGTLRGGVGEFRSVPSPSLLSDAIVSTGLPGSTTQRINCVGPATPTPDWQDYLSNTGAIPASCADGSGAAAFVDAAPSVQLFDPSYTSPHRWTGNLGWSSAYKVVFYSIDGSYSLNVNQQSLVDLNYTGVPRFTLDNEANRPVYVSSASIVPSTGLVSPLDARLSNEYGRVVSRRSDDRLEMKQAIVTIVPYVPTQLGNLIVNGSYAYSSSRSLTRGYDGTTFGDPRQLAWATGFTATHQIRFQLGYRIPKISSSFTTYWGFQSGYPYTPIVGGDINGDGLSNDRAFVFNPSAAPSAAVASGMSTLLASTTSEARSCLESQLGAVAGINSCRRPWSATMNARFDWNKRFGDRWHFAYGSINFANPLTGIDELLHGTDHLRGWGAPAAPDPTLYFVRGFDPTTQHFTYEVNPRFGNTRPSISQFLNPFRVTFEVSFSVNGNVQRQQLEVYMRPTRGAPGVRPPADTILRRLRSTGFSATSPFFWIISNADSLLLSPQQLSEMQASADRVRAMTDSTYKALAIELANLPAGYNPDTVSERIQTVSSTIFRFPPSESAVISRVLTPIQFRLLPATFARSFNLTAPKP
ncbi:MAG TPA: carboxypeptidase-like regulatory domain-containing protein [Gemmatimonadaceae bacterium]|jgi:hypothetical protein